MKLTLLVKNTDDLAGVSQSSYDFDNQGGSVGSISSNDWVLQSNNGLINENHFLIDMEDGCFSLTDTSETGVYINNALSALGYGERSALKDGDHIRIGDLEVSIILDDGLSKAFQKNIPRSSPLEDFVPGHLDDKENQNYAYDLTKGAIGDGYQKQAFRPKDRNVNPLDAFPVNDAHLQNEQNPLAAMDYLSANDKNEHVLQELDKSFNVENKNSMADLTEAGGASVVLPKAARGENMEDRDFDALEMIHAQKHPEDIQRGNDEIDHILLRPLTKAIGLEFQDFPIDKHYEITQEIGKFVHEAVVGLSEIYSKRQGKAHRFPLAQIALQPVEDNPFRLLENSDDVLNALFVDHSPVHLSAPEAARESLKHLHHHQNATESSIDAGLDSILDAFDPEVLKTRFKKYARYKNIPEDEQDAWAWQMYCLYHKELSSHRQKGLKLLFWDIFGQVYDRIMRENIGESE